MYNNKSIRPSPDVGLNRRHHFFAANTATTNDTSHRSKAY